MAYAFATPTTATVKMNVATTAAGNIAQSGDTAAGNKTFSIPGVKQAATLDEAKTVYDAIIGDIAGGTFDSLSATKTITVGVVEVEEQEP